MRSIASVALLSLAFGTTAQITVDPMGPISICGSPTLSVAFTAVGAFNAGNVFTAELSDATGSFASPAVIGTLAGTSSGSITCVFPAGISGGYALRISASDPFEVGVAFTLPITTVIPPNAGSNATITVCSTDAPVNLFTLLGGSSQPGGAWTNPMGSPSPNIFDPAVSPAGCYTYTIFGSLPCANDVATVCVSVNQAADPGTDGSVTLCSDAAPIPLFDQLGGTPQPGGSWSGPSPVAGGMYNPWMAAGWYTYTVSGTAPCPSASALVVVTENVAPNAGTDGVVTVCSSSTPMDLLASLGGMPQVGGTWTFNTMAHVSTYDPSVDVPGCYVYTVPGVTPCINASATVCVTQQVAPNAGTGGTVAWCQSFGNIDLFAQLGGAPDPGGLWTDDNGTGALTGASFAAGTVTPGTYAFTYTVDDPPCSPVFSTVTVTVGPCLLPPDTGLPVE